MTETVQYHILMIYGTTAQMKLFTVQFSPNSLSVPPAQLQTSALNSQLTSIYFKRIHNLPHTE